MSRPLTENANSRSQTSVATLLLVALWFAVLTGLIEGAGLLLFQRLNWARWGPMIHVSEPILWISPLVDVIFFSFLAVIAWLIQYVWFRLPALRILVFAVTALSLYDWLTLTGRLYHWSSLLFAVGAAFAFTRWMSQHEGRLISFWRKTGPWVAVVGLLTLAIVEGGGRFRESRELARLPVASCGCAERSSHRD